MEPDDLSSHLVVLGLRPETARVYVQMLWTQQTTETALAEALDMRPERARSALKELTTWGLVARHDAGDGFRAVVPEVGLEALARRRQADVERARIAVGNAFETHRRSARRGAVESPVEVVTGPAVKLRIRQLVNSARHEIRRLDRPPHLFGAVNRAEIEQLARGVAYRVVYARESLELPGYLEKNVTPCVEAGEQARAAADLPVNMTILDKDLAWLTRPEDGRDATLTIVYSGGLLEALAGLFESCWKTAIPLHLATGTGPSVRAADRRLLVLLNAGVSDSRAAESLGMSRRTFYRRLEQLMALTATTTRFQLAVAAAQRGWL
ncbi:TrmB family transcriptional regulator [Nonomuraea roseoviolacea]|uniref:Sugar-specific transcriptional regulator TrmB/DNA-binding CsgD family transcriptional regulator n=1 Tax=Nonomuraea roseoviolacea subsp. carminata TaxID=160689 RepID=A0ABT1JYB3_9ACTN|nr:helix-turn-helix domain-containing protein [Nonomuraea roseoviolacea]MCP2346742.1 sugar-specific transcriptional regulator TrmB/DNA-binding CsgD family transcriptional regulator [Nonomuraea roseoviolacea subsp. carminata]